MNIQDEVMNIHAKYGMSEMANYKIQLLFDSELAKAKESVKSGTQIVINLNQDIEKSDIDKIEMELIELGKLGIEESKSKLWEKLSEFLLLPKLDILPEKMTTLEYAAIKLKIPMSGNPELDRLILLLRKVEIYLLHMTNMNIHPIDADQLYEIIESSCEFKPE